MLGSLDIVKGCVLRVVVSSDSVTRLGGLAKQVLILYRLELLLTLKMLALDGLGASFL